MADTKRGRPADKMIKLTDDHYKVEPNAYLGVLRQVSNGASVKDALENVGARKIEILDTVDFTNLDAESAKQLYTRATKVS